ncbi:MAG TPA: SDR family NAD(P)-dependent oxidoreductase [Candidatus Hydrogenedentes bacterium]|nr:SDR family NAD(P)-dependent oxidoreductase [Candidatus Hydrogenedentota bacterium]HQN00619.1 SDR family NAD(P)-dependent oxidoreductase [Candidatus Hydrogenedentota bacterium]
MKVNFKEQTVLVTGATRGIGAAIAKAFETGGASLLLTGTNADQIKALNDENAAKNIWHIRWLQADFSSATGTERFLEMLARETPVQVLVNNAGTNRLNPIDQVTTQDLDALLSINLRAPLLLCREVGRTMKEAHYGRIINIASIWSVITKPGRVVYTATKTGLAGMTKTVAADLAPYGVLVNAVSPGFINTELTKTTLLREEQEQLAAQVPLGRFAEPEEIARVVLFLASRENSYLTGQNIVVDGGFTCV